MEAATAHRAFRRHAAGLLSLLAAAAMVPTPSNAGAITLNGITFSDELGGFELLVVADQAQVRRTFAGERREI